MNAITVDRRAFNQAMKLASSVVEKRATIPVLAGLKVTANGSLAFEGTDLDVGTRAEIAYEGDAAELTLLDPRRVLSAVNAAGGDSVRLAKVPDVAERVDVSAGQFAARLTTLAADDHPGADRIAQELWGCEIGAAELAQLARVMPAISTEETRYYLNGICVTHLADWTYRFAATDGHRLMVVDIPLPGAEGTIPNGAILPRRWLQLAMQSFARTKAPLRLAYGYKAGSNKPGVELEVTTATRIALAGQVGEARLSLTSKLIDGTYPDYTRVIPSGPKFVARMQRRDLLQAIAAVNSLGTEKTRAVKLSFKPDAIVVSLTSPTLGEGTFRVEAEHNVEMDHIGFNGQYLKDLCDSLRGDELELRMDDPAAPTVVVDPADTTLLCVLMPMRV